MIKTKDAPVVKAPLQIRVLDAFITNETKASELYAFVIDGVKKRQDEIQSVVGERTDPVDASVNAIPFLMTLASALIKTYFFETNKNLPPDKRLSEMDANHPEYMGVEMDLPTTLKHCEKYSNLSVLLREQVEELCKTLFPINLRVVTDCTIPPVADPEQDELDALLAAQLSSAAAPVPTKKKPPPKKQAQKTMSRKELLGEAAAAAAAAAKSKSKK